MAIPKWLEGFYTVNRRYEEICRKRGWEVPKHRVGSKYCKVEEIVPDREYRIGFEDRDEEFSQKMGDGFAWPGPDYDFDEPILHVTKGNGTATVIIEDYGGSLTSDVYYFDEKIFNQVGGIFKMKVGTGTSVDIPVEAVTPTIPTPTIPEEAKKWWPIVLIGGLLYLSTKS